SCHRVLIFSLCVSCAHLDLPSFPTRRSSDLGRHVALGGLQSLLRARPVRWGRPHRLSTGRILWRRRSIVSAVVPRGTVGRSLTRSEEHTSELQSRENLVCRLLLEKTNTVFHS